MLNPPTTERQDELIDVSALQKIVIHWQDPKRTIAGDHDGIDEMMIPSTVQECRNMRCTMLARVVDVELARHGSALSA